jgi:NADPH2:quinone reductase
MLRRLATPTLARAVRAAHAPKTTQNVPKTPATMQHAKTLAIGAAKGGDVSDELLDKLATLSTQSLIDGLWVMGWPDATIRAARPLAKGQKCAGRAVTLNFVPHRPDIAASKPIGVESPEYEAFELCGPRNVLVMASTGPWESVGGDIKFLRLKQLGVGGLVTDGSVRDTDELISYGFPVFSYSTTPKQGPAFMQPWECNGVVNCGGVVVRPGDAIVGDQDGVVVVPAAAAEQVYEIAHGREVIEGVIKDELIKNPGPPGRYYPFKPPIKPESPLGKLLDSKGIKYMSTRAGGAATAAALLRASPPRPGGGAAALGRGRRAMSTVPATMRAAVVRETGAADVLKVESDYAVPTIADGQVLVKNEYSGINFIDTYHRSGLYARDLPFVGGQEGGGTLAAVTPKAAAMGLKVGDRVAYSLLQTYCEYSAVPAAKMLPVPDGVGLDVATSCVVQGLTAHYLVTDAHAGLAKKGDWMLIHGVGGGTCQWAAQMAKILGYKVIGTVAAGKEAVGRATGVDELIVVKEAPGTSYEDYTSVDVLAKVLDITNGEGCKAVIDGIGKNTVDISIGSLARRGIFVSFGNASGAVPAFPVLKLIGKSAYVTRPKLLDYTTDRAELLKRSGEVFGWLQSGELKVTVDKVFPLDEVVAGHQYLEAGKSTGKVLYKI